MQPIRDNALVKQHTKGLDLEGLNNKSTSTWEVLAKGKECKDDYKVGDIVEAYMQDELPRADGETYIIKDHCILGVNNG